MAAKRLVPIHLDRPRTLRLTLGAYRRILERTELDLFDPAGMKAIEARHLGVIVEEMLKHREAVQPPLSQEEIEEWVDRDNLTDVMRAVYLALGLSLPDPVEGEQRDPFPEARTGGIWSRISGRWRAWSSGSRRMSSGS